MVQFAFTPWRNRAELLRVRQQLFPASSFSNPSSSSTTSAAAPSHEPWWASLTELHDIEHAIARIFMWVHRGGCPHVVESTALLMAAIVFDHAQGPHDAVAQVAVVSGYLVGFTRFVTGLLDSHQDRARKLSMYGVAKTIGLPASFVELRHQGTHEPMPSLTQLRPAARRALVWIWEYYWRNLPEENERVVVAGGVDVMMRETTMMTTTTKDAAAQTRRTRGKDDIGVGGVSVMSTTNSLEARMCRSALLGYLQRQEGEVGEAATEGLMRQLRKWDWVLVITTLADIGESTRDSGMLLRSVKLARTLLGTAEVLRDAHGEIDETGLRQELVVARDEAERSDQRSTWGAQVTSKRKTDEVEHSEQERKRGGGWFKQKDPWVAKPIGVL